MRDHRTPDNRRPEPGLGAWLVATLGLILRVLAMLAGLTGLVWLLRGDGAGLWVIAAAAAMLGCDLAIDYLWLNVRVTESREPLLNQRGAQLAGRSAIVIEDIVAGRGKVRLGDSVWLATGPDACAGTVVWVRGANGTTLEVSREAPR